MVCAAGEGRTEVVARLPKAGVDINARYPNDLRALMWAAGQGHAATVKLLLDADADAKLVDNRGKTAQDIADEAGHLDAKNRLTQQ
ncbi:MAG: ankyrin repeat domain-containing protein [Betaproteobacteria bacterium]|nr:ankyrin repeat domain-containing protein [Betaproteobacteria bacterium]